MYRKNKTSLSLLQQWIINKLSSIRKPSAYTYLDKLNCTNKICHRRPQRGVDKSLTARWLADFMQPCHICRTAIHDLHRVHKFIVINAHIHTHIVHSKKYAFFSAAPPLPPNRKQMQICDQRLISFTKKKTVNKITLFSSPKGIGSLFPQFIG